MPEDYKCIKTELFCKLREGCCPQRGDILLTRVGAGIGEAAIIDTDLEFAIYVSLTLIKLISNKDISNEYILYWLNSPVGIKNAADNTAGKGASQGNLNVKNVRYYYVAVPPIEEQKRIVCKLKELEPLIEKYNQTEIRLYELNSNIKEQLKKSILQYAIEGKLVPQDPNDEPASVLLDRIRKEKQNLIAEGKIKKDKNESIIYRRDNSYYEKFNGIERCIEEEIPYIIPDSWEWIRLGSALINRDSERIPLSVSERAKLEKKYDYYGASGVIDKVDKYLFDKPLLLVGEDGANLLLRSKPIAFIANGKYWVNNHAHVLDSCSDLLLEYVEIYINSQNLSPYVTGTAQPKMNQEKMNSILIPIPPYNEQNRIITESKKIYSILK